MARPRKQPDEKRTASVRADLTVAERLYVHEQATLAGISAAEYTRRRILGFAVVAGGNIRRVDPAFISELNRIGVNVNQLARAVHTDRDFARYWREIGDELRRILVIALRVAEEGR